MAKPKLVPIQRVPISSTVIQVVCDVDGLFWLITNSYLEVPMAWRETLSTETIGTLTWCSSVKFDDSITKVTGAFTDNVQAATTTKCSNC